jgi:hypothetical protein
MKTKVTNKVIYFSVTKLAPPEFVSRKQVQFGMCQLVGRKCEASSGSAVPVIGIMAWIKKAVTVSAVIVSPMITIIATCEMAMMVSASESAVPPTVM